MIIVGGSLHAVAANAARKSAVNTEFLEGIYSTYNDEYFGGRLPKDTAIIYAPDPDEPEDVGSTECSLDIVTMKPSACSIHIAPYANVAQTVAIESMIHEMCHIQTYGVAEHDGKGSHGKEWTACMLGVAMSGGMDGVW
jgi:hypothetical protein